MRITATLLLMTAVGCGGAGEKTEATTPAMESQPAAAPTAAAPEATAPAPAEAPPATDPVAASAPAPEPAPAAATATVDVRTIKGDKSLGTMTFQRNGNIVSINGQFSGHKKGDFALYIYEKGDCSDKGRKVGQHLNPTKAKHGPPASPQRHAGDFGNVTFDKDGNAIFAMETDSITLEPDRADSVVGRAVVVHSRKDSKSGNAGSPLACGVVMLDGAQPAAAEASPPPAEATKTSASASP